MYADPVASDSRSLSHCPRRVHNWDDAVFEVKSEILYRLEFVCDFLSRGIATLLSLAAVRSRSENLRGFMMRRSLGLKLAFV
jgi:hypothetical protein